MQRSSDLLHCSKNINQPSKEPRQFETKGSVLSSARNEKMCSTHNPLKNLLHLGLYSLDLFLIDSEVDFLCIEFP